jgi:hypothetical protein
MVTVRMMQVAIDEIVDVIAVRHRLVPATGSMHVTGLVPGAAMLGRTTIGIAVGNLDHMLVDMVAVRMMQMPVVQIVDVTVVADGYVAAVGTMLMRVVRMLGIRTRCHVGPHWVDDLRQHQTNIHVIAALERGAGAPPLGFAK